MEFETELHPGLRQPVYSESLQHKAELLSPGTKIGIVLHPEPNPTSFPHATREVVWQCAVRPLRVAVRALVARHVNVKVDGGGELQGFWPWLVAWQAGVAGHHSHVEG